MRSTFKVLFYCLLYTSSGRDVMLDAPAALDQKQLDELNLVIDIKE